MFRKGRGAAGNAGDESRNDGLRNDSSSCLLLRCHIDGRRSRGTAIKEVE